jgi:predicted permease
MRWLQWWHMLRVRLRELARPRAMERDLHHELHYHLDRQIYENQTRGMPAGDARLAALRSLDGLTFIEEECRHMRANYIENLMQDLRYAVRGLARNPGFTAVIVLTLTLAIGANSAIFSVINGVLIKPLPYPQPDRLVRIFYASANFPKFRLNPWDFRDYRARTRSFEGMAAYLHRDVQLSGDGEPERIAAIRLSAGYFDVLGLKPAFGREFTQADELNASAQSVILSDRLWRRRFSANRAILGKTILLDGVPYAVVGIMPPGVQHPGSDYHSLPYGESVDAWMPLLFLGNPDSRGSHFLDIIARLKPGVTAQQASNEMEIVHAQILREHPAYVGWHSYLVPLYNEIVGKSQTLLLILLGAVAAVLLIACVNAANLLLARSTARQHEIAIRAAVGAARGRLLRQLLTESLLIALAGAIGGSLVAVAGVKVLIALLPADFPRAQGIHLDATVFAFTLAVALAAGLLFGFAPALQASRTSPNEALREGSRGSTGGRRHLRLRSILVVSEIALASALLIGAGLLLRSFVNIMRSDPGFRAEHVLTASIAIPAVHYKDGPDIARFYNQLVANLAAIPGVQAAGAATDVPWTGYDENTGFLIEGRSPKEEDSPHARYHGATADYFRAMGIPLVAGRFIDERDTAASPQVLIINESMAKKVWPHESAVGKRVSFSVPPRWITVVGVVGDVKDAPNSPAPEPAFWWPESQVQVSTDMSIAVRANADSNTLLDAVERQVHSLDGTLAIAGVRTMDQIAASSLATPRFSFALVTLFACLALALAAIGMYGVIAYSVGQRTHEFGLRMALGASAWNVQRSVLTDGIKLAAAGVVLGAASALLLSKVVHSLLFEVAATDPVTFAAVAILSLTVASLACYVPARRATRSDPMSALRVP